MRSVDPWIVWLFWGSVQLGKLIFHGNVKFTENDFLLQFFSECASLPMGKQKSMDFPNAPQDNLITFSNGATLAEIFNFYFFVN